MLLFSQLFNYFQQILTNELREKLTSIFQRVIVSNEKFNDVNSLKELIENVNQKFHNLKNYQIIKIEIFIRINQSFNKRNIVKFFIRIFIFSTLKRFSVFELTTFKNLQIKKNIVELLQMRNFKSLIKKLFEIRIARYLHSKNTSKKKENFEDLQHNRFHIQKSIQLSQTFANDEINKTNDEFFFEHESKNV